ncbi:LysE family translocator [Promicromonospora sp. MEB111]|uniref:LysE family translocator n=1 Tax=Promicromonospora sp. MEB111 TaxID=3040301 RepID=UPI002551384A|nr:LysE family translocator [Promicromonospora sp. MEB111]
MPTIETLVAFVAASVILIVIPGPSVLFVVGRSLSLGRPGGLLSVLGNELGALPLVAAVALGVGTVVAESIVAFTVLKLLGAGYLVYLGVQAIRHRRDGVGPDGEVDGAPGRRAPSRWVILRQGFVVGVTNPKTIVFFVAALPQFVDVRAGHVPLQMMVLGLVFTLVALVFDSLWALLAGAARTWFASSPSRLSAIRATGGGMMIGLGGTLALTGSRA